MLKVKDSFDKKTLVNYDFSKKDELGVINYFYNYGYWTLRISNSGFLCIESENVEKMFSFIDVPDEILNKIYELFKADLIEKVESDQEKMINEYYANIKGYEGLYQISNCGNVKSITHYRKNRYNKKQIVKGKLLKLNDDRSKGYLIVTLCKNGKRKTYRVHRLVAETFIDNLENLPQVNHKDGNKYNNHINNLEWCSCKENIRHAWKNKLNFVSDKHREVARETQKRR